MTGAVFASNENTEVHGSRSGPATAGAVGEQARGHAVAEKVPSAASHPPAVSSLAELRRTHGHLDGLALLREVLNAEPLRGRTALVSSFGTESAVLLDMVASVDPSTPVIFLDTGKLFAATQAYRDELTGLLGLRDVRIIRPEPAEVARIDPNADLWRSAPDHCCHLRKTVPLDQALKGFSGWITGRKRFHGSTRSSLSVIEGEPSMGRIKLNPLALWSSEDVERYRRLRHLPPHPLGSQGYFSIGCTHCTRAVTVSDDPRAGRWWGVDKSECGIHRPGT